MKTFKKFAAEKTDAGKSLLEAPIVLTPDQIASIAAGASGAPKAPETPILLNGITFDPAAMRAAKQ
jgi:hypothetical protein